MLADMGATILRIDRTGLNAWRELDLLRQLAGVIRRVGPDIVHCVTIKPVVYGGLLCRLLGLYAARGINIGGSAAGTSWGGGTTRGVVWGPLGIPRQLAPLSGDHASEALAVNAAGTIVGRGRVTDILDKGADTGDEEVIGDAVVLAAQAAEELLLVAGARRDLPHEGTADEAAERHDDHHRGQRDPQRALELVAAVQDAQDRRHRGRQPRRHGQRRGHRAQRVQQAW